MAEPMRKTDQVYTYGDYRTWPEDERWELIDGVAWDMSPAPAANHQALCMEIAFAFRSYFGRGGCEVFPAPFDVFFPGAPDEAMDQVITVVQPDVTVVCDSKKRVKQGCWGAPDLVVEILSPYTSQKDLKHKFDLYERFGVKEYWVVDPRGRYLRLFTLDNQGGYGDGTIFDGKGIAESLVFDGFSLDVAELMKVVRAD